MDVWEGNVGESRINCPSLPSLVAPGGVNVCCVSFPSDARTCAMANCQYGCEVLKGEVRCQCPSPGLQLAPDGRTCVGASQS